MKTWHQRWLDERFAWYPKYGIRKENLRLREHEKMSWRITPSALRTSNIFSRWVGASSKASPTAPTSISSSMPKFSGKTLEYFDEESKQKIVPFVIEPSAGADRGTLAFLVDAYARKR